MKKKFCSINIVCIVLLCIFLFYVLVQFFSLKKNDTTLQMKLNGTGVSYEQANTCILESRDNMDLVFWNETSDCFVSNEENTRNSSCSMIQITGNSNFLFPGYYALNEKDTTGCLISKESAQSLFGSEQVEGLSVYWEEKEYIIRDVLEIKRSLLVVNAASKEDDSFPYVTTGLRGGNLKEKERILKNGFGLEGEVWDYHFLNGVLECLLLLLALLVIRMFYREVKKEKSISKYIFQGFGIVLFFILFVKIFTLLEWPIRWSDFEEWENRIHELQKMVSFFVYDKKPILIVSQWFQYQVSYLCCLVIGILLHVIHASTWKE